MARAVQAGESLSRLALFQGDANPAESPFRQGVRVSIQGFASMKIFRSRAAIALTSAAALAMTATPAFADGWGRGHRRHNNDDTGWIVGGLIGLITIGAIAASASSKNKRDRDARYPGGDYRPDRDYRDDGYRSDGNRDDYRYRGDSTYRDDSGYRDQGYRSSSRGIDGAVDNCVGEVERGSSRVDTIDSVDREGEGWRIEGRVSGGKPFTCTAGRDGRVSGLSVDGRAPY